jgi:hypothetical protein
MGREGGRRPRDLRDDVGAAKSTGLAVNAVGIAAAIKRLVSAARTTMRRTGLEAGSKQLTIHVV